MKDRKNILITGATGFIGGHITRYFSGHELNIHCLTRSGSNTDFIRDLPVRFVQADITVPDSLKEVFCGIDVVIHAAALSSDWGSREKFYNINVEGTLNVMEAAYNEGIRHVIMAGSVSSYGEEHSVRLKSEESPENSHYHYFLDSMIPSGMNHYRDSKRLATAQATEFALKHDIDLTILEPVWVYGENEFSSGFYEYLKTLRSGAGIMPGSRKNTFHVIYAGDLAEAFFRAFEKHLRGVHRIIIGNRTPQKMNEIFEAFCLEAGLKIPAHIPKSFIYPVGFFMELLATLIRSKKAPPLTRARVNMFYDSIGFSTARAEKLLSFVASTPLETGIRNTVAWYREHQYL